MTMVKREDVILNATENMVHHKLKNDPSGHDWFHIVRVRNLAVELAHKEGLIPLFVKWLHFCMILLMTKSAKIVSKRRMN